LKIIDEILLDEFRGPGRCEYCGKMVKNTEPHHLWTRGFGGGSRLDIRINIIALCSTFAGGDSCHHKAHNGRIKRQELLAIVAAREGVTPEWIEEEIYRLRRTRK
jgi:hypothetical protein